MKKTLLSIVFLLLSIAIAAGQPIKRVIIEEGTGTWCQYCPKGKIYAKNLSKLYPDNSIFISIHGGDAMAYNEYFDSTGMGFPGGQVERTFYASLGKAAVNVHIPPYLTNTPPVEIGASISWNQTNRNLSMTISAIMDQALMGDYRLGAIVIENSVTGPANAYNQKNAYAGGIGGIMEEFETFPDPVPADLMVYNHVARHLAGNYSGEPGSLPQTLSSGQTYSHTFNWTVPNDYNEENIRVVGVLIDQSDGKVINANISNYLSGSANGKPFFHSEPETEVFENIHYQYDIVTHDPDYEDLTITILNGPNWLNFLDYGDGMGILAGIPTDTGTYPVTLNLTDGNWNQTQSFDIKVESPSELWVQQGLQGFGNEEANFVDIHFDGQGSLYAITANSSSKTGQFLKFNESLDQWDQIVPPSNIFNSSHIGTDIDSVGTPYFVAHGNVFKLNNGNWTQVGTSFATGTVLHSDLILDGNGTPFVAAYTPPSSTTARFDGTNWISTGSLGNGDVDRIRLKKDYQGNPIAIYGTGGWNNPYSEVSRFNGNNWEVIGGGLITISAPTKTYHDVAVGPNGEIYAVLSLGSLYNPINIYKINSNGNWELFASDINAGPGEFCNIEIDLNGGLIVSFRDENKKGRTSVMKYDHGGWRYLSAPGFTGRSAWQELELDPNGIPYIAYRDEDSGGKISVKKYVDLNPSTSIFKTTVNLNGFSLFPNPNKGSFQLLYSEGKAYEIFDYSGKIILKGKLDPISSGIKMVKEFHLENEPSGMYFLKVISDSNVGVLKFIKE